MIQRIVIYHPSSFGGTYDYALHLLPSLHKVAQEVKLVLPINAAYQGPEAVKLLADDLPKGSVLSRRLQFLIRTLLNPIKFWWYVRKLENTLVIFNDFDQLSVPFWVPLFNLSKPKDQVRAVFLHDSDRDEYPPSLAYSVMTMKQMMGMMDMGVYHELLSDKPYYHKSHTKYLSVPFGSYHLVAPDPTMIAHLEAHKEGGNYQLAGMFGNIRAEKNYHLAIQALVAVPTIKLLIAGRAANSGVSIDDFKQLAERCQVADRIVWLNRFLSEAELSAAIATSDMVLLAYSATFASQSAIFASLVPFQSNLVVSEGQNAMTIMVDKYGLGEFVIPDDLPSLQQGMQRALAYVGRKREGWIRYAADNSWDENARLLVQTANDCLNNQ